MTDDMDLQDFAARWVAAWNAHDVDAVLVEFADDAEFASPLAQQVMPGSDGVLRGKAAIRDYWARALAKRLNLRFELTGVFAGVDCLAIAYRNEEGLDRVEVLHFAAGRVVRGYGTYPA